MTKHLHLLRYPLQFARRQAQVSESPSHSAFGVREIRAEDRVAAFLALLVGRFRSDPETIAAQLLFLEIRFLW